MNNNLAKKQGIYIELDALLDTRLATLFKLGPDIMIGALKNGYSKRPLEKFHGVEKEVFDEAYKKRDKSTLKQAGVTKVIGFVRELVRSMNTQAVQTPLHAGPIIYVNVFPYDMTPAEMDVITKVVAAATAGLCDVKTIRNSPEQLTPEFCKHRFAVMFMYNYPVWLEAQARNFEKAPLPDLSVIIPGIYFVREPTPEELREIVSSFMHPLRAMEFASAAYVGLKLHDIDLFCADIPD